MNKNQICKRLSKIITETGLYTFFELAILGSMEYAIYVETGKWVTWFWLFFLLYKTFGFVTRNRVAELEKEIHEIANDLNIK